MALSPEAAAVLFAVSLLALSLALLGFDWWLSGADEE
jgi:hypothetical protein